MQVQNVNPVQVQNQAQQVQQTPVENLGDNSKPSNNQTQQQKRNKPVGKNKPINKGKEAPVAEYSDVTCYSCGEPGHHKSQCPQPPICFICKMVTHKVEDCPVRKKARNNAKFVGSAATGLGFFQIDVPDVNDQHVGNGKNVGIVYVEAGQVTKEELAQNIAAIYKTNWPGILGGWIIGPFW